MTLTCAPSPSLSQVHVNDTTKQWQIARYSRGLRLSAPCIFVHGQAAYNCLSVDSRRVRARRPRGRIAPFHLIETAGFFHAKRYVQLEAPRAHRRMLAGSSAWAFRL